MEIIFTNLVTTAEAEKLFSTLTRTLTNMMTQERLTGLTTHTVEWERFDDEYSKLQAKRYCSKQSPFNGGLYVPFIYRRLFRRT